MPKFVATCLAIGALVGSAMAADTPATKAFARLKTLAGNWAGTSEGSAVNVNYRVTGGGTVLMETQFPGTPSEMVSMYFVDGDKLVLTHYCAARNQPKMKYRPGPDPRTLTFDFVSGTNMKLTDTHIHSVTHLLDTYGHLVSVWTSWTGGKAAGTMKFDMRRVKPRKKQFPLSSTELSPTKPPR
jgi:hypothetical protein